MELMDVIRRRRTVRDFADKEVPAAVIEKALNAGLCAPSYNHQKEWHFILVKDPEIRAALIRTEGVSEAVSPQFRERLESYEPLAREMYLYAIPKQNRMILCAPELLMVVYKPKTPIAQATRISDANGLAAAWCCVENILLSLAEDEVYATTMVPGNTPAVKEAMGVPQELEIAAVIPFGYRAPDANVIPPKEVTLASLLHTDRW